MKFLTDNLYLLSTLLRKVKNAAMKVEILDWQLVFTIYIVEKGKKCCYESLNLDWQLVLTNNILTDHLY
jgi:hypothetical protein